MPKFSVIAEILPENLRGVKIFDTHCELHVLSLVTDEVACEHGMSSHQQRISSLHSILIPILFLTALLFLYCIVFVH